MKKTLIAMAVMGAATGIATADSSVTIHGIVDTGYVYKTGQDVRLDENDDNCIGIHGVEDLGGGLKATFSLEKEFNLYDGSGKGQVATRNKGRNSEFDGESSVGLKGDSWGAIRLGRVNELTTESIRKFDPFYQYGVGAMLEGNQRSLRISNTIRYDSPEWAGFKFGATYSRGGEKHGDAQDGDESLVTTDNADNDGYGIMLGYDNGGLSLVGNWSRLADSKNSSVWNLGASYRFGPAKVELVYQHTKDKGWANGYEADWHKTDGALAGYDEVEEKQWLLGLEWKLGQGRLNASAQYMKVQANGGSGFSADDDSIKKYAIGYTYNLSKRTALYANVAYTDYENEDQAKLYDDYDDGVVGLQIGITHRF